MIKIQLKFATMEVRGIPRISFSREELLATKNSIDKSEPGVEVLLSFLDSLEEELLLEQG